MNTTTVRCYCDHSPCQHDGHLEVVPTRGLRAGLRSPQAWQLDPASITMVGTVQHWAGGVMTTGFMPVDEARQLVADRKAFVITGCAIGRLTGGYLDA
jgi:hypothetical protein